MEQRPVTVALLHILNAEGFQVLIVAVEVVECQAQVGTGLRVQRGAGESQVDSRG